MISRGEATDGDESFDPRDYALRAGLGRDDGESIAPRHVVPRDRPGDKDGGKPPQFTATTGPLDVTGLAVDAGCRPDVTQSFAILRGRKRESLAEQRVRWDEGTSVPAEELLGRWPTDPDAASLLVEDYFQRRRRGKTRA